MKAKIILKEPINADPYYSVYYFANDWNIAAVYHFRYNEPDDSSWNKEKNLARAMDLAKRIEAGTTNKETTIYETQSTDD